MPIEIRPTGEAKAVAQAGKTIGQAKAAEITREQAARQQEMAFQAKQAQTAREWELQKMLMNSQQDFAHEQRLRQAQLDAEARAREWEVEKMEIASRLDFQQEEKERVRRTATYMAGKEAIDNNEGLTDAQKDAAHFYLSSQYIDIPEASAGLGLKPVTTAVPSVTQQRWEMLSPEEQERAARISAGTEVRAARPQTEFERLRQVDDLAKITASFVENGDINPGFGKTIVPLAVRDEDGNLVEATEDEVRLYNDAKLLLQQLTTPAATIEYPDFIKTDEDKEKYNILISRGWTPEAIRDALGQ